MVRTNNGLSATFFRGGNGRSICGGGRICGGQLLQLHDVVVASAVTLVNDVVLAVVLAADVVVGVVHCCVSEATLVTEELLTDQALGSRAGWTVSWRYK